MRDTSSGFWDSSIVEPRLFRDLGVGSSFVNSSDESSDMSVSGVVGTDSMSDLSDRAIDRAEDRGDQPYEAVDTDNLRDCIGSSGMGSCG